MLKIQYAPTFIRLYKNLDSKLKEEIKEKIEFLKIKDNHKKLKVHKLKGALGSSYAFSVNYKIRIVFEYENSDVLNLLYVGNHDSVYRG